MKKNILLLFCALILFQTFSLSSPKDSLLTTSNLSYRRLGLVVGTEAVLYAGLMVGLNSLWYKDFPKSSFHFFNDNNEWLQMDKVGHVTTAYYVGKVGIQVMDWTGMKHRNAVWLGGSMGSIFLTTIEIADGYSAEWGFSKGDILANTLGSLLVIGEELAWNEQRIGIKFSYSPSTYPQYRSSVLGNNFQEKILKDYNAQTYWLSANVASFLKEETKFPKWLNFALGYGADGMLGGTVNPLFDESGQPLREFKRARQYYLSLDVDLSKLTIRNKFLKMVLGGIGFVKFPSPTLEFKEGTGFKFRPFYF